MCLRSCFDILIELKIAQAVDIFHLLTLTYPRYVDSASREAVENTLSCLVTRDSQEGKQSELNDNKLALTIIDWLASESRRVGKRGSTRHVFFF